MWGAIIGDLAGSIYEFEQTKSIVPVSVNNIIETNAFYSDDTILTIAVLDAFLNDKDYEKYLKQYALDYINYKPNHTPYFQRPFSPGFIKWVRGNEIGTSTGNGAMMRISPIGYLSRTIEELEENVVKSTIPSHNTKEALTSSEVIAKIIFLARRGFSKEEIIKELNIKLNYKPFTKFNMTCQDTIDNCLYALFVSNSYEESIRKVISYGGDTDTNACIVGSMAEALYGIDYSLIEIASKKIPEDFAKKINEGYTYCKASKKS